MSYSLQIKISLAGIKPTIWRRVIVNSDLSLDEFSVVIKAVMPWYGDHLHQFIDKDKCYQMPLDGCFSPEEEAEIERYKVSIISDLLKKEEDFIKFEYDFGDSWIHNISVEKVFTEPLEERKAVFVAGKNMAPPEDCGGVSGYLRMLEVLADRNHPEYSNMAEILELEDDEEFDPTYMGGEVEDIDSELYDAIG